MKAPRTIEVRCESCQGLMKAHVGKKEDCRHVTCKHCGQGWDYSAWVIKKTEHICHTKFEASKCEGFCLAEVA